jgi:predicted DNA-binding protein
MKPITIMLPAEQLKRLHELKKTTGCPIVEAIRRAISAFLDAADEQNARLASDSTQK